MRLLSSKVGGRRYKDGLVQRSGVGVDYDSILKHKAVRPGVPDRQPVRRDLMVDITDRKRTEEALHHAV